MLCTHTMTHTTLNAYMHILLFFLCTFRTHEVGEAVAVSMECVPGMASSGGGGFTASVFGANLCMPLSVSPKTSLSRLSLSRSLPLSLSTFFSHSYILYINTHTSDACRTTVTLSAHSPPRLSRSCKHMRSRAHTSIIVFIVTVHDSSWESGHHFSV
jgi:hypothetical protein